MWIAISLGKIPICKDRGELPVRKLLAFTLLLLMTVSFQNCGMATGAGDTGASTTSVNNKALGIYDSNNINQIQYSINGGFRPMVPSTTAVVTINLSSSPASVTLTEHSVDTSKPTESCNKFANLSDADRKTVLSYLSQARLSVKPASSSVAVDCGFAYLSVRLKDTSEHAYSFDNACTSPGSIMIQEDNHVLANLLSHYLDSMLCMADQ